MLHINLVPFLLPIVVHELLPVSYYILTRLKFMHHYIQDSSILTQSYPGSRVDQLWSKLEDVAIIITILSPGCQQPFLVKKASDNWLSAAVFGPNWLVTTGCQQPLPKINIFSKRTQHSAACSFLFHFKLRNMKLIWAQSVVFLFSKICILLQKKKKKKNMVKVAKIS